MKKISMFLFLLIFMGTLSLPVHAYEKVETTIHVSLWTNQLFLMKDGKTIEHFPIAPGTSKNPTPVGDFNVVKKGVNWGSGFGTRWLGLNVPWGIYGIHGTNKPWSIGSHASAGCIRMHNQDVEELYSWVTTGTRVVILGEEPNVAFNRSLQVGVTGKDVVFVQFRLGEMGFDPQGADGRFGPDTEEAVMELQRLYGLPINGKVYDD